MMLPWPPVVRPSQGGKPMSANRSTSYADKVVHIIDTYALPMDAQALEAMRERVRKASANARELLAEEEAAIFLARHLHTGVKAALRDCSDVGTIGGVLAPWWKFAQQAMYRADLGLINRVLYTHEILPLIDDVERTVRDELPEDNPARAQFLPAALSLAL
jgi:hypothetical protein